MQTVDQCEELVGAGVLLNLPTAQYTLRSSTHASGLETYVECTLALPEVAVEASQVVVDDRGFWQRWGGAILSCSGVAVSAVATGLSAGASVGTAGAATPLTAGFYVMTTASATSCGLALKRGSSIEFEQFVQSEDGRWLSYVEIGADLISLGGSVGSAFKLVQSTKRIQLAEGAVVTLSQTQKSRMIKMLTRLQKAEEDMTYFNDLFKHAIKQEGVIFKAGKRSVGKLSNRAVRRALPHVTGVISKQKRANLVQGFLDAFSIGSAVESDVIGRARDLILREVRILQAAPAEPDPPPTRPAPAHPHPHPPAPRTDAFESGDAHRHPGAVRPADT